VGDVIHDMGEFTVYIHTAYGIKQSKGRYSAVLVRSGTDWKRGQLTAVVPPRPALAVDVLMQRGSAS
jgi:hypothetical protein